MVSFLIEHFSLHILSTTFRIDPKILQQCLRLYVVSLAISDFPQILQEHARGLFVSTLVGQWQSFQ